jgi:hypothetical protein
MEYLHVVGLHVGLETPGWKNMVFFLFLRILMDERFIFISSSFRRAGIDFDIGFIIRPINFSLINTSFLIILYANIKNCDFLISCFVYL